MSYVRWLWGVNKTFFLRVRPTVFLNRTSLFWVKPSAFRVRTSHFSGQSFSFFDSDFPIFTGQSFQPFKIRPSHFLSQTFPFFRVSPSHFCMSVLLIFYVRPPSHFLRQTSFPFSSLWLSGFCLFCVPIWSPCALWTKLKMQVFAGSVYTALQIVLPEKLINKILTDKQKREK